MNGAADKEHGVEKVGVRRGALLTAPDRVYGTGLRQEMTAPRLEGGCSRAAMGVWGQSRTGRFVQEGTSPTRPSWPET
jgi:hypothetical protein